jgi:hypothetical protein
MDKLERKAQMHAECTALGRAINTLASLENRWYRRTKKIVATREYLKEIRDLLRSEEHTRN